MFPLESAPSCPTHLVTPECPKPIPDGPRIYRSGPEWSVDLERPRRKRGPKARAHVTRGLAPPAYAVCIAAGPRQMPTGQSAATSHRQRDTDSTRLPSQFITTKSTVTPGEACTAATERKSGHAHVRTRHGCAGTRSDGTRRRALVTCQHAHHRQQDLLHALHRAPPLRAALVAHGVVARRVQDGDADSAVRVDCGGQNTAGERQRGQGHGTGSGPQRRERVVPPQTALSARPRLARGPRHGGPRSAGPSQRCSLPERPLGWPVQFSSGHTPPSHGFEC